MAETIPHLEQLLLSTLCSHNPLRSKDRSIYKQLSRALAPTFYGITEPGGPPVGQLKAQEVLEVGEGEQPASVVKVSRGIYLLDIQTAMADAASEYVKGVPLDGDCFTSDLVIDLLQAALDNRQWAVPSEADVSGDWEEVLEEGANKG
jgi:hypothetical protein